MFTYLRDVQQHFQDYYDLVPLETLDAVGQFSLDECPHLLFYGPDGSFKNEYMFEYIRRLFRLDNVPVAMTATQTIAANSSTKIEVSYKYCDYYLEFAPSEVAAYDKVILSELVKPIIKQKHVVMGRNVIILRQADQLTPTALMCLRRMMEVYHKNALFILLAQHVGVIPDAIRSRALPIRCPLPTTEAIAQMYERVCMRFPHHTKQDVHRLLQKTERDVIKFLITLTAIDLQASLDGNGLEDQMRVFLETLKKTRSPWVANAKIREFSYTMLHYGVHYSQNLQLVIKLLGERYAKKKDMFAIVGIVGIITNADAQLTTALRPQFVFENMWMQIFQLL